MAKATLLKQVDKEMKMFGSYLKSLKANKKSAKNKKS